VQANYLLNACDEVDLKIEILWWKNDGDWCILEFFFEGPASEKSGPGILCAETKTYRAYYDEMLEKLKSSGLKLTDLETYFEEPTVQKNYEIEKSLFPARIGVRQPNGKYIITLKLSDVYLFESKRLKYGF